MELKITTLIENEQDERGELAFEHGLSLYIEFGGKKLLFDTGQTGAFADNARRLGIDLTELDAVFVSHGHYDHSGGVRRLIQEVAEGVGRTHSRLPFYVGKEFFDGKYKKLPDGSWHYNGNPFSEEELMEYPVELKRVEDVIFLTDKLVLFKNFARETEYENPNPKFYVDRAAKTVWHSVRPTVDGAGERVSEYEQDDFRDEIALGMLTTKGLVLIVGCSHVGIVNILKTVKRRLDMPIYCVLGGTHLVEAGEDRIRKTAEDLQKIGVARVAVSHCTGEAGVAGLKSLWKQGFTENHTGNIIRI